MRKIGTALRFDSACARWLIVFNDMLMWSLGLRITEGHWTLSYQTWPVPREHYLLSSSSSVLSCLWPTNSLSLGMRSGLSREHVRCRTWLLPWIRERWSDQIDCCDSSENDPFKMNSLLFKVLCVYCNSLKMPNVVEYNFRGVEFYWTAPKFRRRKFRSSCVYIEFIRPPSNVPWRPFTLYLYRNRQRIVPNSVLYMHNCCFAYY